MSEFYASTLKSRYSELPKWINIYIAIPLAYYIVL
jgi:hypothetical protein